MSQFTDRFDSNQPIIAMAHIPAQPGTPLYDEVGGANAIIDAVARDVDTLVDGGVDGIMFCNENDRPYQLRAGAEGIAMFARVVAECRPTAVPFGVDFLWDPMATMAIAATSGASFMREVCTGVYESDMGVWEPDPAALLRYRRQLDARDVAILMNVTPEFASSVGQRDIATTARSVAVSSLADGILISGPLAGAEPDLAWVESARASVPEEVPVLVNTGTKPTNIAQFLTIADGCIVGSSLKVDGHTWNPVDPKRVEDFVAAARNNSAA